jgi:hypothetical protein
MDDKLLEQRIISILQPVKYSEYKEHGEISSSHGGEYDVQSCLLGCTAV